MAERVLYLFEDSERHFAGISPERYMWMLVWQRTIRDARGCNGDPKTREALKQQAIEWLQSDWCYYIAELLFGSEKAIINRNWALDGCPPPSIARKRKTDYEMESV